MSQTQRVSGVATSIRREGNDMCVRYHNTDVVRFDDPRLKIVLNTGGWKTATTKTRMNQASNQFGLGYQVSQKKGDWFVDYKGKTIPFNDDSLTLEVQS
jgi:hypothetical protein